MTSGAVSAKSSDAGHCNDDARRGDAVQPLGGPIGWGAVLVSLAYGAAVFLPFLSGGSRTLTRHEVLITHPAMQILGGGDWLIPSFAGEPWVDKPPLLTWITAGVFALAGGFTEWASRLPSALSATLLCGLAALLASRFLDRASALLAGLVQATCVYAYMQGRLGEPDMPFALLVTGANFTLAWYWGRGVYKLPTPAALLFHALVGLAVLTKGPLGVALPGASVLVFCALQRSLDPLRAVLYTPAVLVSIVVAVSWHAAVVWRLGEHGLERLIYTYFGRFAGMHHLGAQSPLLYFYTIPWMALPWTVVLAIGTRPLWRAARSPQGTLDRFLWAWFFGGLLVLTLSAFKHKHYCIPILPPLSILTARLLAEHAGRAGRTAWRAYAAFFVGALVVFTLVSGVVMPRRDHRRETVEFLRREVARVPADQTLYVVGLAQSADYPYIVHRCVYLHTLAEVRDAYEASPEKSIWILTLQAHVAAGRAAGFVFETAAEERPREKHPAEETCVIGRIVGHTDPPG